MAFRSALSLADENENSWLTLYLRTGLVPFLGEVCLVGSAEDITGALVEYREAGIGQFLFSGWPDEAEMRFFGSEILPRVRVREGGSPGCIS